MDEKPKTQGGKQEGQEDADGESKSKGKREARQTEAPRKEGRVSMFLPPAPQARRV